LFRWGVPFAEVDLDVYARRLAERLFWYPSKEKIG